MSRSSSSLSALARLGFASLTRASGLLDQLRRYPRAEALVPLFAETANPDQAAELLMELLRECAPQVEPLLEDEASARSLLRILGASRGLAEFLQRHPAE